MQIGPMEVVLGSGSGEGMGDGGGKRAKHEVLHADKGQKGRKVGNERSHAGKSSATAAAVIDQMHEGMYGREQQY